MNQTIDNNKGTSEQVPPPYAGQVRRGHNGLCVKPPPNLLHCMGEENVDFCRDSQGTVSRGG